MSKVIMIIGLPGSGKTTYAKSLSEGKLFDDPSRSKKGLDELRAHVENGGTAIVTDVYSTTAEIRTAAEKMMRTWGVQEIEWVFFANNPEACIANIKRRNREDSRYREIPDGYVREASRKYEIPEGALVIPVYEPK